MRERVAQLVDDQLPVRIGTFHWLCAALLRRYSRAAGFSRPFRLLSPAEARAVLRSALPATEMSRLAQTAHAISAVKNGASSAEAARVHGIAVASVISARESYDRRLRSMVALDLDDLLVHACRLLRDQDRIREPVRRLFDVVLVDEFQDTNPVQATVLRFIAPVSNTVIAVGDDDQAIYGWRQAGEGAELYRSHFPEAEVVHLVESYRHAKLVLRAAASLITHNSRRESKELRSARPAGTRPIHVVVSNEVEEAAYVVSKIEEITRDGPALEDVGVLFRVRAQARSVEDALLRRGIPYRVLSGRRFYEQPEIQTVVAYLRLALDESDDGAALALASRVKGFVRVRQDLLTRLALESQTSVLTAMAQLPPECSIPKAVRVGLMNLEVRIRDVMGFREEALQALIERTISVAQPDLELGASDPESVRENLAELCSLARDLESVRGTLQGLVDRLAAQSDVKSSGNGVSLLTLHAAKGLEFSVVFLLGMEEGLLPHRHSMDRERDIEEERRLCYVGMTRARDRLVLTSAVARLFGGQAMSSEPSRFLAEMGRPNLTHEIVRAASTQQRLSSVRQGEIVSHQRWGRGTVVSVEGRGRATLTTIHFDSVGRQRIQLCHAPLVRLSAKDEARAG
jgi:DNA helicase-2/ATP-dependent DNA helicase PcrA